ncbi:MFS transporter [Chengkuizengella axinellae]|uniref:MFS transporter n=1 Tax=Chengkuizengella axinellae TaxID=3064388 RepID=A0ABT9J4Y4_9BACL|nr:MFS transporter [Chengkuizengella sp. 2205SS18-9]MDP5276527.1 MFS transporter [Chengkuizengella sp. 2205SS18-9]
MITNLIRTFRDPKSDFKNFFLFCSGQFISLFGTSVYSFAISLYILTATGSGLSFATNLVLSILPTVIFGPIAGVLTDRLNRKMIIVGTDLLSGIVLFILFFVSFVQFNLILIYAVTLILNILGTLFFVCSDSAKPNIVLDKNLMKMNAITRMIMSASFILGPVLGGMVYAFIDIQLFILINAVSFVLSGLSELFINFNFNVEEKKSREGKINIFKDIKDGISFLFNQKNLINMMILFILINFFFTFSVVIPVPYIITNVIELSPVSFGIIEGSLSVGILLGAILVSKLNDRLMEYAKLLTLMTLINSLLILFIAAPILIISFEFKLFYTLYYVFIHLAYGFAIAFIDIPVMTMLQKLVPDELRGRVISVALSIVKTFVPLAMITSGTILNKIPAFWLPLTGGVCLFIIAAIYFYLEFLKQPSLKPQQT